MNFHIYQIGGACGASKWKYPESRKNLSVKEPMRKVSIIGNQKNNKCECK